MQYNPLIKSMVDAAEERRSFIIQWAKDNPAVYTPPTEKEIYDFYHNKDKQWEAVRKRVLIRDNYKDQFELTEHGRLVYGNTVHHIIPLRERWDLRADERNLEVISRSNHNREHPERNGGSTVRERYETKRDNAKAVGAVKPSLNEELI